MSASSVSSQPVAIAVNLRHSLLVAEQIAVFGQRDDSLDVRVALVGAGGAIALVIATVSLVAMTWFNLAIAGIFAALLAAAGVYWFTVGRRE